VTEGCGREDGAWGRTRTGTGCPEGFSYQLQLSLLRAQAARICGLDFTFAIP
jgi:hypothetical protein